MIASELNGLVLEVLRRSAKTLHAGQINKALPKPYRGAEATITEVLHSLEAEGKIWNWGVSRNKPVYSAVNPNECARQYIIDALRGPLTESKLKQHAGRGLKGYPASEKKKVVTTALLALLNDGSVVKLPRRGEQYARKPDFTEAFATLKRDYAGVPAADAHRIFEQVFGPEFTLEQRIERAVLTVEPRAGTGGVAWAPDVRTRLSPALDKEAFDSAVVGMARAGLLHLHEFVGYLQLSEEQRRDLVFDGQGKYYGGIAIGA